MIKSRTVALFGSVVLFLISALAPSYDANLMDYSLVGGPKWDGINSTDISFQHFIESFDQYIEKGYRGGQYPGMALAIVKNNQIVLKKGYGIKKARSTEQVDEHTVFRLASTSKGLAAALTGILVNETNLSWEDKLVDYLPHFTMKDPIHGQQIELKHILSHSAGFPYHMYTNLLEAGVSMKKITGEIQHINPIGPVGKFYSYQNAGYSLIGEVLEADQCKSYNHLMAEKIFDPLNMEDASVTYEDLMTGDNVATPHMKTKRGWVPTKQQKIYYNAVPAGGVNASISDMAQYLHALLGYAPEILPPHILEEMFKPQVSCPAKWKYFRGWSEVTKLDYGLGYRIAEYAGNKLVYHGGYIDGFRSEIAFDPVEKIGICLLTNGTSSFPKKSIHKFLQEYYQLLQVRS